MASTNKTTKLQLNQYVSTDKPTMADYNSDMQKIDNAIAGIVDYNSNANGEYYKFADGRLECRIRKTVTDQAFATAYGNNWLGYRAWTFPMQFINTNNLIVTQGEAKWGTGAGWIGGASALSNTSCQLNFFDAYQRATGTSFVFSAVAIGRWK